MYSTLMYSTILYSTLLYSTLLYSTLLYSTPLYSTLLYSTLLYSTLLYSSLLYSTLLYCNIKVKSGDNDFTSSRLNPRAKEFAYPIIKQDSELSPTDSVDSDFAIVEDVLDKLGSTIRQGFALPTPDLSVFNGNPLEYWNFFRSFENTVERNSMNESEKLMYLLQYTTGDAKKMTECCVVMDPSNGYMAARKLLKEHFGHPQIKPSDGSGLLEFADKLKNSTRGSAHGFSYSK